MTWSMYRNKFKGIRPMSALKTIVQWKWVRMEAFYCAFCFKLKLLIAGRRTWWRAKSIKMLTFTKEKLFLLNQIFKAFRGFMRKVFGLFLISIREIRNLWKNKFFKCWKALKLRHLLEACRGKLQNLGKTLLKISVSPEKSIWHKLQWSTVP